MKKIFRFIVVFIIIILFFQIGVNLFLITNKNFIVAKFWKEKYKISGMFYIFPNIVYINRMYFVNNQYKISVEKVFLRFNIIQTILKKNFLIDSLRTKNAVLEFNKIESLTVKETFELKDRIKQFLLSLPSQVNLKSVNIVYGNNIVKIDDFSKYTYKDKIGINTIGKWGKIGFDINLVTDVSRCKWRAVGRIFLPIQEVGIKPFELPSIEINMFGTYNFTEFQKFSVFLTSKNKKELISTGEVKLFPLEFNCKIENKILQGKFNGKKMDDKFVLCYNGTVETQKLYSVLPISKKVSADFLLELLKDNYWIKLNMVSDNFVANVNIYNNNGEFKVKLDNSYVEGSIKYDNVKKMFYTFSRNKNKPFDIQLSFAEDGKFILNGKILEYIVTSKLFYDTKQLNFSTVVNKEQIVFKLNFTTDYTTANAEIMYKSTDTSVNSKVFLSQAKDVNFDAMVNNINIYQNRLSFIISGKIGNSFGQSKNLGFVATLKDCYVNNIYIFDEGSITGEIAKDKIEFVLLSKDKSVNFSGEWLFTKNYLVADVVVKKDKFQSGQIKSKINSKLRITKVDNELKIVGNYQLSNIVYNNKNVVDIVEGRLYTLRKEIIFDGLIKNRGRVYKYNLLLPKQNEKNCLLKLSDIVLFPWEKPVVTYTAELTFPLNCIFEDKFLFSGRLYNENSEITILPSIILMDKKTLKLNAEVKNVAVHNNYIIGNLNIEVVDSNQALYVNSTISNLWVNNYWVNKIGIQCVYDKTKNKIEFNPAKLLNKKDFTLSGEIFILQKKVSFVNFKIYNLSEQEITFNGTVGQKNNLLRINITKIPAEMVMNILNIPASDVTGLLYSSCEVLTVDPIKSDYRISLSFLIKNPQIVGVSINRLSGKLVSNGKFVNIDNIELVWDDGAKVSLKGSYNKKNKNINFNIVSSKGDLSMFNNLYNIVKIAKGAFVMDVSIKGNISSPKLYGYITVNRGSLQCDKYIKHLDNINIHIRCNGNEIKVEKCVAYYKNTKLVINGLYFTDTDFGKFNIFTEGGNGIFVSLPELSFPVGKFFKIVKGETSFPSTGELHFNMELKKDKSKTYLVGGVIMNNTHFTYPGIGNKKIFGKQNNFFYDIQLTANNNVWYENETISANITGGINIKYLENMKKSDVNGEVDIFRGKVNFLNVPFSIKFGHVEIVHNDVYLELEAEADIITLDKDKIPVQLVVQKSKVEEIKPKLTSSLYPELKTEDIAALMLGVGKIQKDENKVSVVATGNIDIDYLSLLRTQFVRIIDTAFVTPIARNILQKWGIADNLTVSQVTTGRLSSYETKEQQTGLTDKPFTFMDVIKNTKYGIEKYVSADMIIGYSITLAELQNKLNLKHEIEISYRLKNNIFVKGIYSYYGYGGYESSKYAGDVRIQIEPRFRFKSWAEEEKE